jgi:hypothetical protein
VLEAARKKAADESVPLHADPQAYFLRMSEDDGTPDYDTPRTASCFLARMSRPSCQVSV